MSRQIYSAGPAELGRMFQAGLFRCTGIMVIATAFQEEVDKVLRKDDVIGLKRSAARCLFEGANPPVQTIHPHRRARIEDFLFLCDLFETLVGEGIDAQQDREAKASDVGGLQGKHKTPKGPAKQKGRVRVPPGGQS